MSESNDGGGDWGDPVDPPEQPRPPQQPPPPQPGWQQPPPYQQRPPGQPPHPPQGYGQQSSQPGPGAPAGTKVDNFMVWSILATLFCCLPTGIVAIVYSSQVNSKLAQGDVAGAQKAASNARIYVWVSVGLGVVVWLLFLLGSAASQPGYY